MRTFPTIAALGLAVLPGAATAQSLPDASLTNAANAFMKADPVLGAVIVVLGIVVWWREKRHEAIVEKQRADHAALVTSLVERHEKAIEREQEAHQETREAWLKDVKEYATIGETVREQMRSVVAIVQGAMDLIRERDRLKSRDQEPARGRS